MKITTNHQYRPVLSWFELTEKEQNEYQDAYDDVKESTFFRYRNWCYDLNDFLCVNDHLNGRGQDHEMHGWDGYKNESFFSSVLVAFSDDHEAVKVGLATS